MERYLINLNLWFFRVLVEMVNQFGPTKWSQIAKALQGRIGKQCRERWNNQLRPNIRVLSFNSYFLYIYIYILIFVCPRLNF